jgi:hypothetical protein
MASHRGICLEMSKIQSNTATILTDTKRNLGPRDWPRNSASAKYTESSNSDQIKTAAIGSALGLEKNITNSVLSKTEITINAMAKACDIHIHLCPSGQEHLEKIT